METIPQNSPPLLHWELIFEIKNAAIKAGTSGLAVNWDKVMPMYKKMAEMGRSYTYDQVNCFDTSPEDTVLDIGCGPGRIACIMAERAKSVTALDAFPAMLQSCEDNAKTQGLTNIFPVLLDWQEAELGKNLERHDIVIASRSVGMGDIRKLNMFANKYAVLICWANAPSIPVILNELFAGTQPDATVPKPPAWATDKRLGYNIVWNMLYDLGADPNIRIIPDGFTKRFASYDEAYSWLRDLRPFDDRYLPVFQRNIRPYLHEEKDGVTFRRETKSYVLWWKPVDTFKGR